MDNLACFYRAEQCRAIALKNEGKYKEAFDICWSLRLRPDFGIYRRASLNLFIAYNVYPGDHDPKLFAQECLDLCQVLREDNAPLPSESERVIDILERGAREILGQTQEVLESYWVSVSEDDEDEEEIGDEDEDEDEDEIEDGNTNGDKDTEMEDAKDLNTASITPTHGYQVLYTTKPTLPIIKNPATIEGMYKKNTQSSPMRTAMVQSTSPTLSSQIAERPKFEGMVTPPPSRPSTAPIPEGAENEYIATKLKKKLKNATILEDSNSE